MKNGFKTASDIDMSEAKNIIKISKSEFDDLIDDLTTNAFTYGMLCGGVSTMLLLILAKIIVAILS